MRIDLGYGWWLNSDPSNIFITKEIKYVNRKGETDIREEVVSGYHQSFESLLRSTHLKELRKKDVKTIEELQKEIVKTDKRIDKICKAIDVQFSKSLEEDGKLVAKNSKK